MIVDAEVQPMKWKLSYLERIVDVNIACFVRLKGGLDVNRIRSALLRVQRKHPVLRALVREEKSGLYYEADTAPEIPLRIVSRITEQDYRRECRAELTTRFAFNQPQLRAVWLRSELESDLLLTTTHRVCDGMSVFTIVREILCALYNDEELVPYEPVTVHNIIGGYRPLKPWKHKLTVLLANGVLRLIPSSSRPSESNENHVEWNAGPALSAALKLRAKIECVSVHAFLLTALERALFLTCGRRIPKAIVNPIDLRRGRFTALKSDMVFFGGGDIKLATCPPAKSRVWARARAVHEEIQKAVEQEIRDIPARFHFLEQLRPLSSGQIRWILRLGEALRTNRSRFGFSNLGNVATSGRDVPSAMKDLRLYVHSFSFPTFGLVPYTVNGEMRFYFSIDERCMSRSEVDRLQCEFMAVLQNEGLPISSREADTVSRDYLPQYSQTNWKGGTL
jgi:hypothetical protein